MHRCYLLAYFIPHSFVMFYAPQYSFWINLVFMPAWSRDNPYRIITLDCTDDIHLHYFCQSLPSSGEV